jgi:hypothetical protein
MHGGRSTGPKNLTAGGQRSAVVERFRDRLALAQLDPALYDQSKALAVLSVAVDRSAERVEELDTPAFRRRAVALFQEFQDLMSSEPAKSLEILRELGAHLRNGERHDRVLEQLVRDAKNLGVLQNDVARVHLSQQSAVNARDLMAFLGMVGDVIQRIAGRADQLPLGLEILRAIDALVSSPDSPRTLQAAAAEE